MFRLLQLLLSPSFVRADVLPFVVNPYYIMENDEQQRRGTKSPAMSRQTSLRPDDLPPAPPALVTQTSAEASAPLVIDESALTVVRRPPRLHRVLAALRSSVRIGTAAVAVSEGAGSLTAPCPVPLHCPLRR